ncbi:MULTISPECIES: DMT family transporter [Rhizobium/Agrobacterium group]|uniref:DMT family transporter n=1 Tax=Rhizobium/Agrobacterium group TaxID=227290 RepID=UPI001ADB0CDA|nr:MULTISPECIES: DMT family transporter [Rhizobium/Agrobacterium group]MBO9112441.1 DMT family transporter [Agrobacterium sp. S2/73]QXZ75949.1 DMT family transporter [Agrobacterium sp. S7/73]QYA17040.1 DMT family transporter [Rhizobium sp. AB2/73]UEQ85387.1 DMT family transporter [Rhizobium sp. AB2/73]
MASLRKSGMARSRPTDRPMQGILLCIVAYGFLCLQDAAMKWLVEDHSVTVSLFWRSLAVLMGCLLLGGRRIVRDAASSSAKGLVVWRALVSVTAWVLYYLAARHLSLAEMTTLYFSAPVIVVILAVLLLKERANPWQWISVLVGFTGVIVATGPGGASEPLAVVMVLGAAVFWAYSYILMRQLGGRMGLAAQVMMTNLVFVAAMGATLPWQGSMPGWDQIGAMALVGLVGGLGQLALFASFERASATMLAPFEYSGLVWAFLISTIFWGTPLDGAVLLGAAIIAASGIIGAVAAKNVKSS